MMTREEVEKALSYLNDHYEQGKRSEEAEALILAHDAAQRQEIEERMNKVNELERILNQKGYRKSCDIPACNCGDQWNHGGFAETRLREISDALPYMNGKTILQRVEHQAHTIQRLREALSSILYGLAVETSPCRFDHHGNCQEHFLINPCAVSAAQRILEETR